MPVLDDAVEFRVEPGTDPCATRDRCRTAILVARSLGVLGRADEAVSILASIEEAAATLRLARTWQRASEEIRGR